jgi:hypothetical protein
LVAVSRFRSGLKHDVFERFAAGEAVEIGGHHAPALKDGQLGGAALDVWWQYPTPAEPERRPSRRPFHELPNVLITPHSSSSSDATAAA